MAKKNFTYKHSGDSKKKFIKSKKIIVFDLDSTLIFSKKKNGKRTLQTRPNLLKTLDILEKKFNLAIFTSGNEDYAAWVLKTIEKKKKYFYKILSHDDTKVINGKHVKDLRLVTEDLRKVLLIDDKKKSFMQPENGILISHYTGETKDNKLNLLTNLLNKISNSKDMPSELGMAKYKNELKKIAEN